MKIGFDLSQTAHTGGVGIYTQKLAEELLRLEDLEMVFFYSSLRKPYHYLKNLKEIENGNNKFLFKSYKLPPTLLEILFNKFRNVSIERFLGPIDVFHSSDWIQPPTKAKKVTTYHDLIPLKYPKWSHPKVVAVHKRRLKIVEKEIDIVITVSESTKKDLLEVSKIPEEKIVVIYEGVDKRFKPQTEEEIRQFKKDNNLPDNFVLAVGGIGERKNLKRIKEACSELNLVVLGESIRPSDEELPLLYCSSKVLVYTSLYEGFGLPVLEAMACGVPVITSNISSMPEVAGNAALLVNPNSITDMKKKVELLFADKKLQDSLTKKGFDRAKKFTWKKCAEQTAAVYNRLAENPDLLGRG